MDKDRQARPKDLQSAHIARTLEAERQQSATRLHSRTHLEATATASIASLTSGNEGDHWARPPVDGDTISEVDDNDSDHSSLFSGSNLVDDFNRAQRLEGARLTNETPADFEALLLHESFEEPSSTLGSRVSMRRLSRDWEREIALGREPTDLRLAAHLLSYQRRSSRSGSGDLRRDLAGSDATMRGTIATIHENDSHGTVNGRHPHVHGRDRDLRSWASGESGLNGTADEMSALRPLHWYAGESSGPSSPMTEDAHLVAYNSLAFSKNHSDTGQQDSYSSSHTATRVLSSPDEGYPESTAGQEIISEQPVARRLDYQSQQQQSSQEERMLYVTAHYPPPPSQPPSQLGYTSRPHSSPHSNYQFTTSEVVMFMTSRNPSVAANSAAYLQHISYNNDQVKREVRERGGIPILLQLLTQRDEYVQHAAVGVLRNISFGKQNVANKFAIYQAGGLECLGSLLRITRSEDVQELITGVLYNMSSCEQLKLPILQQCTTDLVSSVVVPASGWDPSGAFSDSDKPSPVQTAWTAVLRNATGTLRNLSSAGPVARNVLRRTEGLTDALLWILKAAIGNNEVDNRPTENAMCVLRNLSFRLETETDPADIQYAEEALEGQNWEAEVVKERCLYEAGRRKAFRKQQQKGIVSWVKKRKGSGRKNHQPIQDAGPDGLPIDEPTPWDDHCAPYPRRSKPVSGALLLFQPEMVQPYIALAAEASNPETLEAAAGALQNLTACNWKWSAFVRNATRKEKGLPILAELLAIPSDAVVRTAATALRNMAVDPRNRELIGKYGIRDLVWRLPGGAGNENMEEATVNAVICCIQELVSSAENARILHQAGGVLRLVELAKLKGGPPKLVQSANQACMILSNYKDMRVVMKNAGWMYSYYVNSTQNGRQSSVSFSTTTISPEENGRQIVLDVNNEQTAEAEPVHVRPVQSNTDERYEQRHGSTSGAPLLVQNSSGDEVTVHNHLQRGGPGRSRVSSGRRQLPAEMQNNEQVGRSRAQQQRPTALPLQSVTTNFTATVGPPTFEEDSWV